MRAAETYLGDLCWQMDETPPDVEGPVVYKFGVYAKEEVIMFFTEQRIVTGPYMVMQKWSVVPLLWQL